LRGFVSGEGASLAFGESCFFKLRHAAVAARIERKVAWNGGYFLSQVLD
jgi:hypothetical protein